MYCALCGRPMDQAAVLIGSLPVGAKRAGLMPLAQRKSGLVFPVLRKKIVKPQHPLTPDMFDEVPA